MKERTVWKETDEVWRFVGHPTFQKLHLEFPIVFVLAPTFYYARDAARSYFRLPTTDGMKWAKVTMQDAPVGATLIRVAWTGNAAGANTLTLSVEEHEFV